MNREKDLNVENTLNNIVMEDWSFSEMEKEYLKQLMNDETRYEEFLLNLNGDGNGIVE